MPITPSTLEKLAHAAASAPEPIIVPWPMPGNVGGLVSFADYKAWQDFIVGFSLSPRVPELIARIFERAQKLYLLGWIDLDLVGAAELTALMPCAKGFGYFRYARTRSDRLPGQANLATSRAELSV